MNVSPQLIAERIKQDNIKADMLVPAYLDYRLDRKHLEWFVRSSTAATSKINQDFRPFAVYEMLVLWNKQFSVGFAQVLEALGSLNTAMLSVLIFIVTLGLILFFHYKRRLTKFCVAYSIATTGFFGMLMNLVLIFSFQVVYGYLYHMVGLLISVFMAGTAAGSIFMTRKAGNIKNNLSVLMKLEAAIILFSWLAAKIITAFSQNTNLLSPLFMAMFFISGLFLGLEFPLVTRIYLKEGEAIGYTSGLLYFSDLMGGWLAGIVGGVVFLPVLGLFNTCLVIIAVKLSSLLLLAIFRKSLTPHLC
jgi:spermidine synthase